MNQQFDPQLVLEQFRQWLSEAGTLEQQNLEGEISESPLPRADETASAALADVVSAFTVLRHELKLQTKSARGLQEQAENLLAGLADATRRFDSVQSNEAEAARRAGEPLAEGLAGLDEALERGMQALEQSRRQALGFVFPESRATLEVMFLNQPFWRRWLIRPFYEAILSTWFDDMVKSNASAWNSLRDGYRMVTNRLQRTMETCRLKRIVTVGQTVDPHCMNVVDVLEDPERAPGTVVDELRPGYYWNDKILRFAEVRAVRNKSD